MAVNATAIWRLRPSGSNTNGGGYDVTSYPGGTDYSRQNSPQATGTLGTASGTTTFTDAGGAFTAPMVGNVLWIASGAGFTTGPYFVVTFNSSTSVVLDRSPGTGTAAHWAVGGGWADPVTNTGNAVSGNTIFTLGSGTPNPSSYTYDYTISSNFTPPSGSLTTGNIYWANDPSTPGYKAPPDTTGGMPVIQVPGLAWNGSNISVFSGLYFVASAASLGSYGVINNQNNSNAPVTIIGSVFDQFGFDVAFGGFQAGAAAQGFTFIGDEVFSSVVPGSSGSNPAIGGFLGVATGNNNHDTVGPGMKCGDSAGVRYGTVTWNVIAKCRGTGILVQANTG